MLLTKSSGAIGLATLTVIGTVLPFSTSGGTSSLILPVFTGAPPVTLRIADASDAGVASAGRSGTIGTAPSTGPPPAKATELPRRRQGQGTGGEWNPFLRASSLPIHAASPDMPRYPRFVRPTGSACRAT